MESKKIPYWLIKLIQSIYTNYPGQSREAKVRGGHLSAVLKFVRRDALFAVLKEIQSQGIDVTPTFARNLIQDWTNQGADWPSLLKVFGRPGRSAENKSKDFQDLPVIAEQWRASAIKKRTEADQIFQEAHAIVKVQAVEGYVDREVIPIVYPKPFGSPGISLLIYMLTLCIR